MKKFFPCFILLVLCCFPLLLFSSTNPVVSGARSLGMASAGVTLADPYSILGNQAGMAFQDQVSFSLHGENRFLQSELGAYAAGITLPIKSGAFGLAVNYTGFDLYNESKIGVAYALLFAKNISGSLQLDYCSTSISEYGTASAFTAEAGLMLKINQQLTAAAHVFNPLAIGSGFEEESIPTVFRLGLSYAPGEKVLLIGEAEKDIDFPARAKAAIEYRVAEVLHLRGGVATNPSQYSFGFGLQVQNLKIDLASSYHQVLGLSPGISVNYSFGKK
jgi:hypothetical protein